MRRLSAALAAILCSVTAVDAAQLKVFRATDIDNPSKKANYISVTGPINYGDHETFTRLLQKNPSVRGIYLNSNGGNAVSAIQMAEEVFERRLATMVPVNGQCHSGCALMFLMGREKFQLTDSVVSIHSVHEKIRNADGTYSLAPIDKDEQLLNGLVAYLFGKAGYKFDIVNAWINTPGTEGLILNPEHNLMWRLGIEYVEGE
jgi:hypothetical protein